LNYSEIIFYTSALLGFVTVFLIGNRYKNNRQTNLYLVVIFATSSIRFLFYALGDFSLDTDYLRQLDLFIIVSTSPLVFLYFKKLVASKRYNPKENFLHVLAAIVLFAIINSIVTYYPNTIVLKSRILVLVVFNLFYAVKSYFLLHKSVWKRKSNLLMINQQNVWVKKWTYILFGFFILVIIRFTLFFLVKSDGLWYQHDSNFLWVTALMWIVLYLKVLYSPEFLYGYDLFQNKIKEYKKYKIVFDTIWILKSVAAPTNFQDNVLKEKIDLEIDNYIIQIEHLALAIPLIFTESFKLKDLSDKLNIPKSHVIYVFKYHAKISFNDFKKIVRIQNAIGLIEKGFLKMNTLEALAIEIGFSSYSAFFKSFKSVTGVSPKEYYHTV